MPVLFLAAVALLVLAYPLSRVTSNISLNYSEGWNAYWIDAARLGRGLYLEFPARSTVNYPPISFHLVALFSHLTNGDVILAGRLVGVACLFWSAANVGVATTFVSSSRGAGWLAGLSLLLWIAMVSANRIGTNDPHFLALALSTLGLCAALRAEERSRWIIVAAALFATAIFVKNAMLGFPLATGMFLLAGRRWRALAMFAASGIAVAAIWFTLATLVDGPFFLSHLLMQRSYDRAGGLAALFRAAGLLYAPLLMAIAGSLSALNPRLRLPSLCLLCAGAVDVGFVFGNGVSDNIFFEAIAALAVVCAASLDALRRQLARWPRGGALAVLSVLIALGSVLTWAPTELYGALGRRERAPERAKEFAAGVDFIKHTEGQALCESLLMCFEAGKPLLFDPYYVKDQIAVGRLAESQVVDDLKAKRFDAIEIGEDDPNLQLTEGARLRFTAATMQALLANYRVALRTATFAILVPL